MEDYKLANIEEYFTTDERLKFSTHPSKIVGIESFRRRYNYLVSTKERILDLGGGAGIWTEIFREEGVQTETYALDISPSMLKERVQEDIGIVGDMENLPFEDGSFDRAFFFASLHHVGNTQKALAEAKRIVRSGGYIVLCEPISLRLLLLGRDIEAVDETQFCFSILYLLRLLRKLGMQLTYIYYRGFFRRMFPVKMNVALYRLLDRLDDVLNKIPLLQKLGMLGNNVTIVVQKPSL